MFIRQKEEKAAYKILILFFYNDEHRKMPGRKYTSISG
jgi:hypothetical protein